MACHRAPFWVRCYLTYMYGSSHCTAEAFSCKLPMFADDMTLYASRRTQAEAVATVTDSLSAISVDLDELGLRINTTKTVTLMISKSSQPLSTPIVFNQQPLTQVSSTRILGVIVDSDVSWSGHIDFIVRKTCTKIGALRRCFRQLSLKATRQFILSVILPDLLYCCSCFAMKLSAKDRQRLSSVYRRSVRAACGSKLQEDVMPLLARLSIDPFEHYLIRSIAKFIHVNHVVFPLPNLTDLFPQVSTGPRTTRSSFNAAIAISKFRTTDGVNSFSNRAALFFNSLPVEWRTQHRTTFAKYLQTMLKDAASFQKYFDLLFSKLPH